MKLKNQTMKLSDKTLLLLKNFSGINQSILFRQGNKLRTISVMKNILAEAEITEEFPKDFGIYDLNQFLNGLNLHQNAELDFENDGYVVIREGKMRSKYFFADPSVIVIPPDKEITLPSEDVCFELNTQQLDKLLKASAIYQLPDLSAVGDAGVIKLVVRDKKNDTSKTVNFSILNKINVINNVYKQSYKNKFVTGFGDFLRGCYFILEFCDKFNLEYNIAIIHPIQKYLKNKSKIIPQDIADTIEYCEYTNVNFDVNCSFNPDTSILYHEFFDYLNKQSIFNKNIYLYTICYPTFKISSENKNIVRNLIEPVDGIKISIDLILKNLDLSKKGFEILHIRSGDQYLNKTTKTLDEKYKVNLLDALNKIIDKNNSYLLIADSILVKNFIIKFFPFIKTFFKNITHLGENSKLDDENILNTLIDFYIFSYSKKVYSISCYEHGSGFSRWYSFTYDVPYHCIKV